MHWFSIIILVGLVMLRPAVSGAVDLTGRWHFELDGVPNAIVTVTQTGSALTIPWTSPFTGTVGATDANGYTSYQVSWTDGTSQAELFGRVTPSGNLLDGRSEYFNPGVSFFIKAVAATRCTCFDANATNGDGCDAACQVEPCWTCSGDPSVCTPTPGGGGCDDGSPCTAGEICTAGACGGGAPVAPPCFDMSGPWTFHDSVPEVFFYYEYTAVINQHGTDLRIGLSIGSIDPMTGVFDLRSANRDAFCDPADSFDPATGSVAADGFTFSASFIVHAGNFPDRCAPFAGAEIGDHCGDGMFQGAEECDDGNLDVGDGCSNFCVIDQCWTCTGIPSVCAPAGGGPCDDGNQCTVNDTCAVDGECGGAPRDCGQCSYCDYFVGCIGPNGGFSCDDGDACTTGDVCAGDGSCSGSPLACEPCFACDTTIGCVVEPQPVCKASTAPERSVVSLKNDADDRMDRFNWRWSKGADTTPSELGDPTGSDDITLCLYDESTSTPDLLFRATIPAGTAWTAGTAGFRYRETSGSADGVPLAWLRSGSGATANAKVKGKGVHLSDRPYGLPALPLPLPLRVQLQGGNGLCLETRHDSSGVLKDDPSRGLFKARGVP